MADPNNTPKERIRIFDRSGVAVAEFRAAVNRSWIVGDEGRAQFQYATRETDIVNDTVLRFGNWLLVQSDTLPAWVGVLDPPMTWGTRTVTVSAYTPEHVFGWRIGPLEEVIKASAGAIFANLIGRINRAEQTILRAGSIWRGGIQREETLNPTPLKENLKHLWQNSGEDYTWSAQRTAEGNLYVNGDWLPSLGEETTALLHEGKGGGNVEATGNIMVEDGPIVNSLLAYGDGETWVSRPNVTATSPVSIGRYGLRQSSEEYNSTTSLTTLMENGVKRIAEFRLPAQSFTINALNVGDTFKYIRLGNILRLQLQNAGFKASGLGYTGRVRIIGMQYNSATKNKVGLVVREVVTV